MDDKQYLLDLIKDSNLPQEVKDELVQKIATQGATVEVAKEVADLLDLNADVLEMSADVAEEQAKTYEDLANGLETADKEEDAAIGKVMDDAEKELDEIEQEMKATPQAAPAEALPQTEQVQAQPATSTEISPAPQETPQS
ncbi:hypothetical protein HY502_03495 [Candidatus Woesebacteria bacterium]|nr:hypothetical protein [Candidatus Woesebacteria bacterium]